VIRREAQETQERLGSSWYMAPKSFFLLTQKDARLAKDILGWEVQRVVFTITVQLRKS
jgi:hypothetical protein